LDLGEQEENTATIDLELRDKLDRDTLDKINKTIENQVSSRDERISFSGIEIEEDDYDIAVDDRIDFKGEFEFDSQRLREEMKRSLEDLEVPREEVDKLREAFKEQPTEEGYGFREFIEDFTIDKRDQLRARRSFEQLENPNLSRYASADLGSVSEAADIDVPDEIDKDRNVSMGIDSGEISEVTTYSRAINDLTVSSLAADAAQEKAENSTEDLSDKQKEALGTSLGLAGA
jgi:hypothetical protein